MRFVSKPTVNSRMHKTLFSIAKRKSGRNWSPVITEGLIKPGRSTYSLDLSTLRSVNFVDGRITFKPNLFFGRKTLLRVADRGSSSHFRMYLVAIQSRVSQTQV